MPQASGLQFTAHIGGFPRDFFSVVGFELTESLSSLFCGRLDLAAPFLRLPPLMCWNNPSTW